MEYRPVTVTTDISGARALLERHYRDEGWWTGERLSDRFGVLVEREPGHIALIDDHGTTLTRADLWERASAFAENARAAGIASGDVVMVYLPNVAFWQVCLLGLLQVGAVPATIPLTTDEVTLAHSYQATGARGIIAPRSSRRRPTAEWAHRVASASGAHASVAILEDDDSLTWSNIDGFESATIAPAGVDHLMFTSSTTGMPKAVMHTADTLAAVNRTFAERFGVDEHTPIFMPSPLGHSVGSWHGARLALWTGATLVLQEVWDPVHGLELVDRYQCVFSCAATPFLKDIVDAEWPAGKIKLASLKNFLCGGAPVPPSLMEQAAAQAPNTFVTVLWGMTEGTGTTCVPTSSFDQLTNSAGMPVAGLELTVLHPGEDGTGELAMRGPQVFVGYLGQEDTYRELLTPDGFFRTGDLARLDDEGYVHLTGRLKDLIIRGGVNISPVPIENAIAAHPEVRRVAVIGQPDDRLGERICAVIVPVGPALSLEELNTWLTDHGLSPRKLPESLLVVEEMPVTAAGKIRKADLRRQLEVHES